METLGDEQGGVGVPEVVESQRFTDRRSHGWQPEPATEVGTTYGATLRCGEDPPVGISILRQVLVQFVYEELRHGHGPL